MKKKLIIVAILIMSVGFALISTNLIINGTSTIGKTSFDVYFSGAEVDGYDKTNEVVKSKKNIEFTSKDLLFTNDTSELIYEVTNNSSNYDAKINISCTNPSNKITVEEVPASLTVHAKTIETGSIVVTLNEMAVDKEDVVITCTLNVNAEERTSLATDEIVVGTYGITGTLVDNNNQPLTNQYLAIYSETKLIVKTDMNGRFLVKGLERGIHEIYLITESNIDSSDTEIKNKPKGITSTNKNETIVFSNNYKIKEINVSENLDVYFISFDLNYLNSSKIEKVLSKGDLYGTLPIVSREDYKFTGWYTSDTLQDETTKVESTDVFNLTEDHTLYSGWKIIYKWRVVKDTNNNLDLGDIISIADENFYVITTDSNNIKAIAMYGLNENTNIQSATDATYIKFATDTYWDNQFTEVELNHPYNLLYPHIMAYNDYLNELDAGIIDITLMSFNDVIDNVPSSQNDWFYQDDFWLKTAIHKWNPYYVCGSLGNGNMGYVASRRIKPYITISNSLFN